MQITLSIRYENLSLDYEHEILWGYLTELRKELVESQKIRTQVIGFKITFVTALIGFFLTKLLGDMEKGVEVDEYNYFLLVIPAVFFDFLIYSFGFSIKRIGLYIRYELEPRFKEILTNKKTVLWQEFLVQEETKQPLAKIGNIGLTSIAIIIAIISILWFSNNLLITIATIIVLLGLVGVEIWGMTKTDKMIREVKKNYETELKSPD